MTHEPLSQEQAILLNQRAIAKRKAATVLQYVFAVGVTLFMIFPLYWMFITSVKSQEEVLLALPTFWPKEWHFENYSNVLSRANFSKYYYNTIVMTAGILFSQVVTGVLAAYGFSKGRFKGQKILFLLVLGALMIPLQVTFIPLYIMFANWKLTDTFLGLILPEMVSPYYIFMMRQAFLTVDDSYIEAAKLDGMGRLGIITRVLVPMCKSTLITITLVTFTNGWNSYFWPKIIAKNETRRVLTVGLVHLRNTFAGLDTMNNHEIMAGAVLAVLPVIVLFFIFQKYMLTGYEKTAMK
ncbi:MULTISPECIES: carbohydrate ABC transporter permease [Sphaerochaeta]|jgi:multiple sugar transport system permease protein|uniref:Carbohydrate ABC transporter permease n=1 Tax=Sphaerochaeta associata TaxID=1129264 RepID=A0ABY4DF82_9SPIR|nr:MULTISPECIES: carbohydrate ABC transporter permease [Sphaerochaeta]MDT3359950.1 carbohydrate ABC transporter permease [Spirochaetota bacterium]MDD2395563.1 carbohydrate ABC transporter permease [Sphaerochaeta sp.]MDD3423454.1 carbohydrate ABC transporter permease [Sphaerochaeta sp.]MDD3455567.1 carbohydrate ABC transporter permease [Sphaerochaeta sp.]MDD4037396.1 carbohydrate ABC transporter permease [Sphaerochaeta sp.]